MTAIDRAFAYFEQFKDKDIEDTLRDAKRELAAKDTDLAAAVFLLRRREWGSFFICDFCDGHKESGHKPDCQLNALLLRLTTGDAKGGG